MSRRERQRRRNRSKGGPARIILLTLGVLAAACAIGAISAVGYVISVANSGPSLKDLSEKDYGSNSILFASDGTTKLGVIQSDILRTEIPSSQMPRAVRQATVAIEDKRFYEHGGVDFEGVVRAALKNLRSGDTVQGGSTLTMQLIRNLYTEDRKKDYKRKLREARLAEELENVHTGKAGKEWILTKYLNNVPYGTYGGQQAIGVWAASRVLYNKRPSQLTLAQAALIAGLPQAPTSYNPFEHPDRAKARRNEVLGQMLDIGFITPAEAADAKAEDLDLKKTDYYQSRREKYFFDYVRAELVQKYGVRRVRQGGLRVYTTIDLRRQAIARQAIKGRLGAPGSPSAALVSIDPRTGYIKTMASSGNYADSKFNLAAQGKRQPGSTFKIIVLMTALRRGVDINKTSYMSKPLDFKWHGTPIKVTNSDGKASGHAKTLFEATVSSDNTVFQQLDLDLGPENVTKTARDMGITSHLDSFPAEGLGGLQYGVSVLEMARAFVTVNDGGYRERPIAVTKVVFPSGKVDTSLGKRRRVKVFTDGQTYEAIKAMKANAQRGTGTAAQLPNCPVGGKTGTTSGFVDAWFNGITPGLNTTVWVGYPKVNTPMTNVPGYGTMFGGDAPAQIWHDFMARVVQPRDCVEWPQPKEPFVAKPFFGELTTQAGGDDDDIFDESLLPDDPDKAARSEDDKKNNGGTKYPPGEYETKPQPDPQTPPTTDPGGTGGISPGTGGAATP